MPKLVYALENHYQGPMCLNDNNTLGVTNFAYSPAPYIINGFAYIDEFFAAANGIIYARVLFINDLEPPQELSSQRHYYKLAEVVSYPAELGIAIATVHEKIAFNPWILQNWIIDKEEQKRLNIEQWQSIQNFMQQQYKTELAAIEAYHAAMEAAKAKRELQIVKSQLTILKTENEAIKAKMKLAEQQVKEKETAAAATKKSPAPAIEPKLSKAQKLKNRRDDILLKASRIAALATMATETFEKILDLLKYLPIANEQDRAYFTNNLNISINSCGYLLNKLHKRTDISSEVKLAFLYRFISFSDDALLEYANNNITQNFITMAAELSTDAGLNDKIQIWNNNKIAKINKAKMLDKLNEHLKIKQKTMPELLIKQAILHLNFEKLSEVLRNNTELNKQAITILKTLLPALSESDPVKLKQFLDAIKLPKDLWQDIYNDAKVFGAVKMVALQWAETEAQSIFDNIAINTNQVKIPKQLLPLLKDKTSANNQTLLMLALSKSYPDSVLEQIFINAAGNLLTIDWNDQTILHYIATYYKGSNYELIRRIRNAFIKAIEDAKQHFPEMIHMQADKDGATFLHRILQGKNEDHACNMLRVFLTEESMSPQLRNIFCNNIFNKNNRDETISIILDSKDTEWRAARRLIYALIPGLLSDYEFAGDYGDFFCSNKSNVKLIELAINDPHRLLDILDARTNLQLACNSKIKEILAKTPEAMLKDETDRLRIAKAHFNFGSLFNLVLPGTEMNIHRTLAQKICAEYNTELETKYNNSVFYKYNTMIALQDSLIWHKFAHAFRVWWVLPDPDNTTTSQHKNLSKTSLALTNYVISNTKRIPEAVACFFELNESPSACALFINLSTRNSTIANLVYSEFFKFKDHCKFTGIFKHMANNFKVPAIAVFARHVLQFAFQTPINFGLLLQLLTYNNSKHVTLELMQHIYPTFNNYDDFLAAALNNDCKLLICNLLSKRDPATGRITMDTLCRVAASKNDFEPLYKMLELIKDTKYSDWDPEADFIQSMFKNAAEQKNLPLTEAIITRFKPRITAEIILTISDSEKNITEPIYTQIMQLVLNEREKQDAATVTANACSDKIVEIKPNRILQRSKPGG